ncbi:MAG: right-handed parallel beta-helix repeat-containing protein, partial [Bacteroidales bacterium]|nr:right-handed parallel beta-helix repeat-containing protein [Bacteroidales bacterium]
SGASTTFSVEIGEGATELYAVYPASAGGSYDSGNVNVHFNGSRTDGSFAANDICVAKAVKTGDTWSTTLAFKNVACLLKVGVTANEITKIQVMGGRNTDEAQAISGYLPVGIDGSGDPVFGTATDTGGTVSVTVTGPGNYYIPVMPDVVLSDGFRIGYFRGEEQLTPFFYAGSFTTERGKIIKLSNLDDKAGQYYVTPSGAGTKAGQSWTNAMGVTEFKAFVTDEDNHFLLKGSTFHFSADEFSFGDDYLVLNYPNHGNVAFTLEGTFNSESSMTTFIGRTATYGTTAGVLWPQQNSYITVRNVKFTGTNGASNASAIRMNNSAKELNLDHCIFDGNQTSGNGSGISLFNSATVNISNCVFKNATGAGGIIHVNHASAKVNIVDCEASNITKNAIYAQSFDTFTCTRVTFSDNNDSGEYGAAAYISGAGTITFDDCDFIRNHSSVQGGAICINGTDVTTTFTDCEFIDNDCDQRGGAVMIENANDNTTFTGGKFQGNNANGADTENTTKKAAGGAIYSYGSFSCTDVLFKENYNFVGEDIVSGGIIRIQQSGKVGYFDGCVFDGNYTNRQISANNPCAAIVNCRIGDVKYYFNACEFKENTSGVSNDAGRYGGLRGTVFATLAGSTFAFNNCSFHDNYGGRNVDDISWIGMDNTSSTLILANTTIVGDNYRAPETGAGRKNNWGVIKFQNTGNYYFLNTILCSLDPVGNSFWVNGDIKVDGTTMIKNGGPKLPVY